MRPLLHIHMALPIKAHRPRVRENIKEAQFCWIFISGISDANLSQCTMSFSLLPHTNKLTFISFWVETIEGDAYRNGLIATTNQIWATNLCQQHIQWNRTDIYSLLLKNINAYRAGNKTSESNEHVIASTSCYLNKTRASKMKEKSKDIYEASRMQTLESGCKCRSV